MTESTAATASRVTIFTTYAAVSLAIAALALTGHESIAVALAVPVYSWLQANMHRRVRNLQRSIGPANGETVHALLERLVDLDTYSHKRNHDILGGLTPSNATLALLLYALCDHAGIDATAQPELRDRLRAALDASSPTPTEGTNPP